MAEIGLGFGVCFLLLVGGSVAMGAHELHLEFPREIGLILRRAGKSRNRNRLGMQPWALSLPDKELCLREALAVCTPPAPEPSAKRPGS